MNLDLNEVRAAFIASIEEFERHSPEVDEIKGRILQAAHKGRKSILIDFKGNRVAEVFRHKGFTVKILSGSITKIEISGW